MSSKNLNQLVLEMATGHRCGVTLPFQNIETTSADIKGLFNISLPKDSVQSWDSASGGLNRDKNLAVIGAIAESMERYSASIMNFPVKKLSAIKDTAVLSYDQFSLFLDEQYNNPGFVWEKINPKEAFFGEVYSVYDNEKVWVPQELIGLGTKSDKALVPSTSTGLAAHFDKYAALLLGIQELLERDALTVYWLNSLGGREIALDKKYTAPVENKFGQIFCFDITQIWNPYPVVIICGHLNQRNKKRFSMGVACRATYEEAIEKAYLEWIQGAIFAGFYDIYHPELTLRVPDDLIDFDEHAVYYTLYPQEWGKIPLLRKKFPYQSEQKTIPQSLSRSEILRSLLSSLQVAGIKIFYRDITLPDVRQTGLTVVRALSPELSFIHGDERAPFLGGRTRDVAWRYPDLVGQAEFPNKYPHPLG